MSSLTSPSSATVEREALKEWCGTGSNQAIRKLYIPATALLAFSYPLTTVWLLAADAQTGAANLAIKGVIAGLFMLSLLGSLYQGRRPPARLTVLYLFFIGYGLRLVYDVALLGIVPPLVAPSYILLYFFALTFLPVLAIGFSFDRSEIKLLHDWMFWVIVLANISILLYIMFIGDLRADDALAGRFEVRAEDETSAILNPITVSLMGAALALVVVGHIATSARASFWTQALQLGLFGIGIANLLFGGSRGPVVAFIGAMILVAVSVFRGRNRPDAAKLRPRMLIYLVGLVAAMVVAALNEGLSIGVFDRFRDMFVASGSRVTEARDYIYAAAWKDFIDSPLIGNSYLTMNGAALPHNPLLEALTAAGILGGVAYLACLWFAFSGVLGATDGKFGPHGYSIAMAILASVILSMTSGTVGQAPEIWVLTAVAICFSGVKGRRGREVSSYEPSTIVQQQRLPLYDTRLNTGIR